MQLCKGYVYVLEFTYALQKRPSQVLTEMGGVGVSESMLNNRPDSPKSMIGFHTTLYPNEKRHPWQDGVS